MKEVIPKKVIKALREELETTNTAFPLLYLIAQIRSNIINNGESGQKLKLISHMYDICQDVLMQFTDFLILGGLSGSSNSEKQKGLERLAG